jgi:hypothetical protein
MPFYGDNFRANFFDLKNSINRQNNGDLEPLKGFGINLTFCLSPSLLRPLAKKLAETKIVARVNLKKIKAKK